MDEGFVTAQTQALQENAERLGIIWKRRPATVVTSISNDPTKVMVVMDGDTETVSAYSLIGAPPGGSRIMCDIVPPSGIYIIGYVDRTPGSIIGGKHFVTGGTINSGIGGTETAITNYDITINEPANRLMILEATYKTAVSNNGVTILFRIRRGGMSGTAIREDVRTVPSVSFGYQFGMRQALESSGTQQRYIVTAQTLAGGTCDIYVSSIQPNFFLAYDEGNYANVTVV